MRGFLTATAIVLALLAGCVLTTGCSAAYWTGRLEPGTHFTVERSANGFAATFDDTKDNNLVVDEITYDPTTKTATIKGLKLTNSSSTVIAADAARMQFVIQGQLTQVAYLQAVGTTVSGIIGAAGSAAAPILGDYFSVLKATTAVGLTTPWGGVDLSKSYPVPVPATPTTAPAESALP
jgi:hypothetical protein